MISVNGEEFEMDKEEVLKDCFELVRVLGEGSFGKVYLIRNKETSTRPDILGKEYALKRYNRNHIEKRGKYRMLVRSIFILQSLKHQSIIKFVNYIISPDDSTIYLLFEPCKKGSLDKLKGVLSKRKEPKIIKLILYELALALCYLKASNVAHRDLKPSNITFNSKGELKIIDFDEAVCFDPRFTNLSQSKMLKDFGTREMTQESM
jgi:serine/threonine protein kinase